MMTNENTQILKTLGDDGKGKHVTTFVFHDEFKKQRPYPMPIIGFCLKERLPK